MQTASIKNKSRSDGATRRNSHLTYRFTSADYPARIFAVCLRERETSAYIHISRLTEYGCPIPPYVDRLTVPMSPIFRAVDTPECVLRQLARINIGTVFPRHGNLNSAKLHRLSIPVLVATKRSVSMPEREIAARLRRVLPQFYIN